MFEMEYNFCITFFLSFFCCVQLSLKVEFQWRLAKVVYFIANAAGERGDTEKKKQAMYEAKDAAMAAIKLDEKNANGHKW